VTTYVTTQPNGVQIDLDSLPIAYTYSGDNVTEFITTYQGKTYKQTITYSGDNVTNTSEWEEQ
jgi:3-polyprenyl-4-hydroxybenzoate decarboxylase